MEATNDRVLYRGDNAEITSTRATVNGQTVPLSEVISAGMGTRWVSKSAGWAALIVGLIILVVGYFVWGVLLTPMVAGFALMIVGIVLLTLRQKKHVVHLFGHDGSITAVATPTREEAERLISSLDEALKK